MRALLRLSPDAYYLAVTMGLAAAFVLGGYEFIRSPSNTLFKTYFGKEYLPMVMTAVPVGVVAMLAGYGRILSALGPRLTLMICTYASIIVMALAWMALLAGYEIAAIFLYVFRSAYVVLLIEQYWSLINTSLNPREAARLNGPICGLASLGAIAAGFLGDHLAHRLGTVHMIAVAALLTFPALIFSALAYRRMIKISSDDRRSDELQKKSQARDVSHMGLRELFGERVLIIILLVVILTQALSTSLGIVFQGVLQDVMPDPDQQTAYSFRFYAFVNLWAAMGQFLLSPLLLMFMHPRTVQTLIPLCLLSVLLFVAQDLSLEYAGMIYMLFKVMDYSVFRSSKELFYIPMSFEARFRAKEVIDILGYRSGKGGTAAFFSALQLAGMRFSEWTYSIWSMVFCLLWLASVRLLPKGSRSTT